MTDIPIGELRLECNYCGSADLSVADDATEDSPIVCNHCGTTLATIGELKAQAGSVGRAQMPEIAKPVRKSLKLPEGFKSR
jgi:uncharacterized Zn finger protein